MYSLLTHMQHTYNTHINTTHTNTLTPYLQYRMLPLLHQQTVYCNRIVKKYIAIFQGSVESANSYISASPQSIHMIGSLTPFANTQLATCITYPNISIVTANQYTYKRHL